jgi:peroxiredoxin
MITPFIFADESKINIAPDFVLPDMEGKNYRLSENFGKGPILINFWATWCVPCREEMKKLKNVYKEYEEDGLEILAISVDDPKTVSRVKNFIKSRNYPFHVLLDTNSEILQLYQAKTPPYTALIDYKGNLVYSHSGYRQGDEKILEQKIIGVLEQQKKERSDADIQK